MAKNAGAAKNVAAIVQNHRPMGGRVKWFEANGTIVNFCHFFFNFLGFFLISLLIKN